MPDSRPTELFRFASSALPPDTFHVTHFRGAEGLNTLFSFTIDLVSTNASVDPAKVLGAPADFFIHRDNGEDAVFQGYPARMEQGGMFNGYAYYRVELRPAFWKLTQAVQSAIFLSKTVQETADELLNGQQFFNIPHEFRFTRSDYPSPEFAMQYGESVYDYILWRMEEQGAYFFFAPDGDKLIFADSPQSHDAAVATVHYSPASGLEGDKREEVLTAFTMTQTPLPLRVVVRSFDWKKPNTAVVGEATVSAAGMGDVYLTNENVESNDEAARIAKIRAEELVCRSRVFTGAGSVPILRPGVVFTLQNHFNQDFNRDYMVTEITHEGAQETFLSMGLGIPLRESREHLFYRNSFSCIEDDVAFRPARTAPRVSIPGVIRAFVDGAGSGARAEMDEYGRYKLIFPFDISGRNGGNASCWIRMAQPQVGMDSGMSFPLLPGAEVTVAFLGGNPDRPVITGALPNGSTGAITGSGNANFSGIRTAGGNQITINDTDNKQGISLLSASGHGLSFGDGSPNVATLTSDNYLSAFGVASSDIAGLCQNFVTGYRSLNAVMQYDAKNLMLWNMLSSQLLGAASDTLSCLSSSAANSAKKSKDAGNTDDANKSTWTSEGLAWGSTSLQLLSTVISGALQIIYRKKKGQSDYNISMLGSKEASLSCLQVAPSKAKLIIAMTAWLSARLVGATLSGAAKGVEVENEYDEAKTKAGNDDTALNQAKIERKAKWSAAGRSFAVSGASLIADITAAVCALISTAKKEDELGGLSFTALDSNINLSAKKSVSAHSCEGIYLRTNEYQAGPPPTVLKNSKFGTGTGNRTTLPNSYEDNVQNWKINDAAPSFAEGYIALDSGLLCEQADGKASLIKNGSLSKASTHLWRSGKNTMLMKKDGKDAGIQLASDGSSISLDVKDKATAALDKDGVLLVSNKTGLLLQSGDDGAAVLKADTGSLTLEKDKVLLSTSKAKIFCGDDIRLKGKNQTEIQDLFIQSNSIKGLRGTVIIGDAIKVMAYTMDSPAPKEVPMSESKSSSIDTKYHNLVAQGGMIGSARTSAADIPEEQQPNT